VFTVEGRRLVEDRVLAIARADERVVAGAAVGSLARSGGDRFSDVDLTFGIAADVPLMEVLTDWSAVLAEEFGAVRLFDLPSGGALYRVFLTADCLQVDLSVASESQFGAMGPDFRLLFGKALYRPSPAPPDATELIGYAAHHVVRARVCIERGRPLEAEYWISAVRDNAASLACLHHGLPVRYARGVDRLPGAVRDSLQDALVRSLDREELFRAARAAVSVLLAEARDTDPAALVGARLRALVQPDSE
jgi:hypothetical protein